ncbi:hypothetical protein ACPOL_1158 [Acidisarcina polymorpha]|uniref:Uncharacterized protein n=1 Tax=Acidisarcina polymorpha TaxID=2211140 RepID=A0A2Z5FVR7_9BACT|nr:hypothetical protein ACPOL_1158 [Acidisarcina polymorpha]
MGLFATSSFREDIQARLSRFRPVRVLGSTIHTVDTPKRK